MSTATQLPRPAIKDEFHGVIYFEAPTSKVDQQIGENSRIFDIQYKKTKGLDKTFSSHINESANLNLSYDVMLTDSARSLNACNYRGSPLSTVSLSTIPGIVRFLIVLNRTNSPVQYSFLPFFSQKTSLSKSTFYVLSTSPRLVRFLNSTIPWEPKICTIWGPSVLECYE